MTILDTSELIKLLSRISYSHSNEAVVKSEELREVVRRVADVNYVFIESKANI
jgi:hypothetical protein